MRITDTRHVIRTLSVLFGSLLLVACNDFAGTIRQFTYPPDFVYVSGDELESRMQQLGYELQQLDLALATEHDDHPTLQQQVVTILRDIERIGGGIQAGEAGSNHPFLQDDMGTFLASVRQARMAASLNPPRYYMAGRVSGGCSNCHRMNR